MDSLQFQNAIYHFVDTKMTFEQIYSVQVSIYSSLSFSFFPSRVLVSIFKCRCCCCSCFFSLTIMRSFSEKFNRAAMLCDITETYSVFIWYIRTSPIVRVCSARYFHKKRSHRCERPNSIEAKTKLLDSSVFSACNANVLF